MIPARYYSYLRQLWLASSSHRLILLACYCYRINRGRAVCNSRVASISPCSITSSFFFLPTTTVHYLHCLRTNTNLYPSWKIKEYDNPRWTSTMLWWSRLNQLTPIWYEYVGFGAVFRLRTLPHFPPPSLFLIAFSFPPFLWYLICYLRGELGVLCLHSLPINAVPPFFISFKLLFSLSELSFEELVIGLVTVYVGMQCANFPYGSGRKQTFTWPFSEILNSTQSSAVLNLAMPFTRSLAAEEAVEIKAASFLRDLAPLASWKNSPSTDVRGTARRATCRRCRVAPEGGIHIWCPQLQRSFEPFWSSFCSFSTIYN